MGKKKRGDVQKWEAGKEMVTKKRVFMCSEMAGQMQSKDIYIYVYIIYIFIYIYMCIYNI